MAKKSLKEGIISMKGKKILAGFLSAAMVFGTMAFPAFADAGDGTQSNPYTLAEFNKLTDVSGKELWVNLGDLDISEQSVTLGSYVMSDEYKWVNKGAEAPMGFTATERENAQGTAVAYRTNKDGATIHIRGTIKAKNGAEDINDHVNTECLYFQIPEKSTIILDGMTISGVFDLVGSYNYYYNTPDGSIAHQLTENKPSWATNVWYGYPFLINKIEINNSTVCGSWFHNGKNFKNVAIDNTEFKSFKNTVLANNSNPIWWQNMPGLESFTMTNSKVTSTRPFKFEGSSKPAFNATFTGNTFTMESGSKYTGKENDDVKNAAIYFGKGQNFGNVNISNNTISGEKHTQLAVISGDDIAKMSMSDGKKISITDNKKADGTALTARESVGMWKSTSDTWESNLSDFLSNGNAEIGETAAAEVNGKKYSTLAEAVESAEAGDTVKLLCNTSGDGIVIAKNLTIDFNGFSYTVNGTLVGSPKSETNCFQLLAGADSANPVNIKLKNGKIISSKLAKWGPTTDNDEKNPKHNTGANIIVQNYSNLTLDNMTIDGDQTDETGGNPSVNYGKYVLSNNNGHTVLTGDTNIIAAREKYAFDVYGGWYPAYPAVSVTLDEKMTGTITGNIQVSNGAPAEPENFSLSIKNGTLNGEIKDDRSAVQKENYPKLEVISGGTFSTDASKFCVDGFTLVKDETTGLYTTKKTLAWETDTDSGSYVLGDKKYGMMRFMFKTAPEGEVTASGIKYINASDIAAVPTVDGAVNTTNHSSIFQGDIVKVPEGKTGTYYAKAYVTTAEGTFWSEAVGCSVNWDQFFADYKEGQE